MNDNIGDFLMRIILLLVVILLGAGLTSLGNLPGAKPQVHEASLADVLAKGEYVFPSLSSYFSPPLSYDETIHKVGEWGCRLRSGIPYSILAATHCF